MDDTDTKARWYVMHVMSGLENKVFTAIRFACTRDSANVVQRGEDKSKYHDVFAGLTFGVYEVCIPIERIEERKNGKKTITERKLYPGYILIRMRLFDDDEKLLFDNLDFIKNTKGVIGFIGGQAPVPLSQEEAREMLRMESEQEEEKAKPKVTFNVGEQVIIKEGPFESCEGVIESVDGERQRLKVSVSIFGRYTPVDVENWQVERSEENEGTLQSR